MIRITTRLTHMLLGWGFVGLVYTLTDHLQPSGTVLTPGPIDQLFAFNPAAIWSYLSFFVLIPLAYLCCPADRIRWLRISMQVAALVAGAIYLLWPTTMDYPAVTGDSLNTVMLVSLIGIDSAQNCLPSLHMALTTLAVLALQENHRPLRNLLLCFWGALIAVAVLQLRRHLFIDVLSGAALGFFAGSLAQRVLVSSNPLPHGAS
jgi:membrane-associated phospholipid phosphatase